MNTQRPVLSLIFATVLVTVSAVVAKDFELEKVSAIQEVRSMSATLVNGFTFREGKVEKPVDYAFYVALKKPIALSEADLRLLSSEQFKNARLDAAEIGKMTLIEAGRYFVLLDHKSNPVCLLSHHDGRISLSRIIKAGADVFQNDSKKYDFILYEIKFPQTTPLSE